MIDHSHKDALSYFPLFSSCSAAYSALLVLATVCLLTLTAAEASDSTNAQHRPATTNGLESGQQSTSQCEGISKNKVVGEIESPIASLQRAKSQHRPLTCLASVQEIHGAWIRGDALLVDVRRSAQYQTLHIPSSLNLAPFSIKSKRYLTKKRLVLVNNGHNLRQLEDLCNQLKAAGFQRISVMAGGLHAWVRAGFNINGDRLAVTQLGQVSPAELISALSERDWKIIDLDRSLGQLEHRLLPESDVIEYPAASTADMVKSVNQAQSQFRPAALSGFLVVSRDGKDYSQAKKLLQLTNAKDIFYLSGGIDEFNRYLQTHSSLIERLSRGFREQYRCSG